MTTREERAEWREWLTYPGGEDDDNAPLTRGEALRLLDALDACEDERDRLAAAIERVRALPATPPSGGYYMVSMREVLRALDGADQ